jgi:hypothetical protein
MARRTALRPGEGGPEVAAAVRSPSSAMWMNRLQASGALSAVR